MEVCEFDHNEFYVKIIKDYNLSYQITKKDALNRTHVLKSVVFPSNDTYSVQQLKSIVKTFISSNSDFLKQKFVNLALKVDYGRQRKGSKRKT